MKSKWFGEIEQPESELNRVMRTYLEYELDAIERGLPIMARLAETVPTGQRNDTIKIRRPAVFNG